MAVAAVGGLAEILVVSNLFSAFVGSSSFIFLVVVRWCFFATVLVGVRLRRSTRKKKSKEEVPSKGNNKSTRKNTSRGKGLFPLEMPLCRVCYKPFVVGAASVCAYHPESWSGETAQRWKAPGEHMSACLEGSS